MYASKIFYLQLSYRLRCYSSHARIIFHVNRHTLVVLRVPAHEDTGGLGYDGPLNDRFLHMTDDMLGPSPMDIKYTSYVYDGFCI